MKIVRESILHGVSKAVKHGYTAEEMKDILINRIGFKDVKEFDNPYFGQCYSLVARK